MSFFVGLLSRSRENKYAPHFLRTGGKTCPVHFKSHSQTAFGNKDNSCREAELVSCGGRNKYRKLGGLEQQNCIVSQPGGQKSETKASAGPCPSKALGKDPSGPLLASGGFPAWGSSPHVLTWRSPWVCVSESEMSPFYKYTSHTGLGPALRWHGIMLTSHICNSPLQVKPHSKVPGSRTSP